MTRDSSGMSRNGRGILKDNSKGRDTMDIKSEMHYTIRMDQGELVQVLNQPHDFIEQLRQALRDGIAEDGQALHIANGKAARKLVGLAYPQLPAPHGAEAPKAAKSRPERKLRAKKLGGGTSTFGAHGSPSVSALRTEIQQAQKPGAAHSLHSHGSRRRQPAIGELR
jgi:hypothetical protein